MLLREHELNPETEFFDVNALGLKISDPNAIQPRYRMRLWVTATDSNVETGPHTGKSKDQFNILIVSENELLSEIAKEEEGLYVKLDGRQSPEGRPPQAREGHQRSADLEG